MADWIAVDETTRQALREALGPEGDVSTRSGSAFSAALDSKQDCVILLPTEDPVQARLVTIRRLKKKTAQAARPTPSTVRDTSRFDYISEEPARTEVATQEVQYEATGFLGLNDEVVYEDEPSPKKAWWKKLVQ